MRIVELSGGVGGARLARGLAAIEAVELTVVVNVGDDMSNHGLYVCPDLDTVVYTLAAVEGPQGWGRKGDTFAFNDELARFGVDNTFQLGDRDLALNLYRTNLMAEGVPLSKITQSVTDSFDVKTSVVPVTNDRLRTSVRLSDGWVSFQEYFVDRGHRDEVLEVRYQGAEATNPSPGVLEAMARADRIIIGPSNPPLSIWPVMAVPGVRETLRNHPSVTAVSPLIGGETVKGPANRVMRSLGLTPDSSGVAAAYEGLIDTLIVHTSDAADRNSIAGVRVVPLDIMIPNAKTSERLASQLLALPDEY